jgi:integrase
VLVTLHAVLARFLRAWRTQTPFAPDGDSAFPSPQVAVHVPPSVSVFAADHLRPAAKKAGVNIKDDQRFGLHNLRHTLSKWMMNKAKVKPKTVQEILRHTKIQTTLDLYTQEDADETQTAQGEFLNAVGNMSAKVN